MKKIFTILTFILIANSIYGQDTIYYDNEWNKTNDLKISKYYKVIESKEKNQLTEKIYFKTGQIKSHISYLIDRDNKKKRIGKNSFWYESGEIKSEIHFENGKKNGTFISYWKNGKLKRKDYFKRGKFKNGECWNENGEKVKYYNYEIRPSYPGGQKQMYQFIKSNLKYPPFSKRYNIGGKVVIGFKIDTTGRVSNIKIIKTVNAELDNEALRIIKNMPKWNPGYQDGNAVTVKFTIPVVFKP